MVPTLANRERASGSASEPAHAERQPVRSDGVQGIQAYGMVVTDQSGGVEMEDEQQSDWTAEGNTGPNPIATSWDGLEGYQVVAGLPWSSLQAVDPPQD